MDLFLSFSAIAGWLSNLTDPDLAVTLLVPSNQAINNFVAEQASPAVEQKRPAHMSCTWLHNPFAHGRGNPCQQAGMCRSNVATCM